MLGTWLALLFIVAVVGAWVDALASRERAVLCGRDLCREAGMQMLDQTVSLKRFRIKRVDGLPAFARRYAFEVSIDGSDRHRGHLDLAGSRLESWSLPLRDSGSATPKPVHLRLVQ